MAKHLEVPYNADPIMEQLLDDIEWIEEEIHTKAGIQKKQVAYGFSLFDRVRITQRKEKNVKR